MVHVVDLDAYNAQEVLDALQSAVFAGKLPECSWKVSPAPSTASLAGWWLHHIVTSACRVIDKQQPFLAVHSSLSTVLLMLSCLCLRMKHAAAPSGQQCCNVFWL